MVTIHTIQPKRAGEVPVMPFHTLRCKKKCRSAKVGETIKALITKFSDSDRYAIMEATYNGGGNCKFYEVFTEKALHETFDE